jgi:hypothetical protein
MYLVSTKKYIITARANPPDSVVFHNCRFFRKIEDKTHRELHFDRTLIHTSLVRVMMTGDSNHRRGFFSINGKIKCAFWSVISCLTKAVRVEAQKITS